MIPRIFRCLTILMFAIAATAFAQETRGTIAGRVLDESGASMPGVSVTVTNLDTNVSSSLTTNSTGYYEAPLLLPGNYRVTAELQGFRTTVRTGVTLSVSQRVDMDLTLAVGAISESVTVTGDATILDTSVVTTGQNLDRRSVEGLPMFANMPVLLTRFVAGVNSSADVPYVAQGFVNRTSSDTSSPGGVGGNEWTIDGATNNGSDRRLAASPNADMIQEVRIETANFDASFGHSTGLGISMMTRSGTNLMHGSMNYQYLEQPVERAQVFREEELLRQHRAGAGRAETTRWPTRWHRRRSTPSANLKISPTRSAVRLSRTSSSCSPTIRTTSTIVLRTRRTTRFRRRRTSRGDFSNLLAVDPVRYQIYDPLTVRPDPARPGFFIRDPFPGNIIPANRIVNPMYQHYIKFLPTPNNNPTDPRQEPANNYVVRTYTDPIQSQIFGARLDYNHSNTQRFFGRWSGSHFIEGLDDWTYQSAAIHAEDMKRTTLAGTGNWTWIKSNTTVIDAQLSANAFHEGGDRKTLATHQISGCRAARRTSMRNARRPMPCARGSTRGGSCALPIVNFGDRFLSAVRQKRRAGIRHAQHTVQLERDACPSRPYGAIRHRHAASCPHRVQSRCEPGPCTSSTTPTPDDTRTPRRIPPATSALAGQPSCWGSRRPRPSTRRPTTRPHLRTIRPSFRKPGARRPS